MYAVGLTAGGKLRRWYRTAHSIRRKWKVWIVLWKSVRAMPVRWTEIDVHRWRGTWTKRTVEQLLWVGIRTSDSTEVLLRIPSRNRAAVCRWPDQKCLFSTKDIPIIFSHIWYVVGRYSFSAYVSNQCSLTWTMKKTGFIDWTVSDFLPLKTSILCQFSVNYHICIYCNIDKSISLPETNTAQSNGSGGVQAWDRDWEN